MDLLGEYLQSIANIPAKATRLCDANRFGKYGGDGNCRFVADFNFKDILHSVSFLQRDSAVSCWFSLFGLRYYPDLSFSAHALQQAKQSGSPPLALRPIWQIDETEFDITVLVDTYAGNFADRARKLGWDSNVILRETNPLRIADSWASFFTLLWLHST